MDDHRNLGSGSWARGAACIAAAVLFVLPARAGDWTSWRGPEQNGVSRETALPEKFSREGENVVWKASFGGRSTPIVMNGRVYILNRAGSGKTEEERVMCFDAGDGHLHWEYRFPIFLTDIPSNRVGWSSPVGDPETGYVFAHGVQGTLLCLDRDGKVIWERSLHEEYGVFMGYGGRIYTPIVDGDLVIVSFLNSSWGSYGRMAHRYLACDKRTGSVVWWSEIPGPPKDTTYSTPVVAVVNGMRLLIDGGAGGAIHALKVRTGEMVWTFQLSKHGINSSVVVAKDRVYACHSEENIDTTVMGRLVAIDATGTGDVTKTHEKWRIEGLDAGYSSPALHDGRLYVFDNGANLNAIEAETGKALWKFAVGTVMKASPVVADGKIYVGEVNARFVILKPGDTSCTLLHEENFPTPDGKVVEVNGSAAVANGRVYFTTRDELYCIGFKERRAPRVETPISIAEGAPAAGEPPAHVQVSPADVVLSPGQSLVFSAKLFDAKGRFLRMTPATWTLKGIKGSTTESGKLTLAPDLDFQAGSIEARVDSLAGEARVRVVPRIPFTVDFEKLEEKKAPPGWVSAGIKFLVAQLDGQKVLQKVSNDARFLDGESFFGLPNLKEYTIAADVRGSEKRRNLPNITLLNSRYQLVLMGNHQRLRLVSWLPMPRLDQTIPFEWKPDVWYRMQLRAELAGERCIVRGKVWPRDQPEPSGWTIEVEDPAPNGSGSPGIQAYTAGVTARSPGAEVYFDNIQVLRNEP